MTTHFTAILSELTSKRDELDQLIASLTAYCRRTAETTPAPEPALPRCPAPGKQTIQRTVVNATYSGKPSLITAVADAVSRLPGPFGSQEIMAAVPAMTDKKRAVDYLGKMARDGVIERVSAGKYQRTRGRVDLRAMHAQIRSEVQPQIDAKRKALEPTV